MENISQRTEERATLYFMAMNDYIAKAQNDARFNEFKEAFAYYCDSDESKADFLRIISTADKMDSRAARMIYRLICEKELFKPELDSIATALELFASGDIYYCFDTLGAETRIDDLIESHASDYGDITDLDTIREMADQDLRENGLDAQALDYVNDLPRGNDGGFWVLDDMDRLTRYDDGEEYLKEKVETQTIINELEEVLLNMAY